MINIERRLIQPDINTLKTQTLSNQNDTGIGMENMSRVHKTLIYGKYRF